MVTSVSQRLRAKAAWHTAQAAELTRAADLAEAVAVDQRRVAGRAVHVHVLGRMAFAASTSRMPAAKLGALMLRRKLVVSPVHIVE